MTAKKAIAAAFMGGLAWLVFCALVSGYGGGGPRTVDLDIDGVADASEEDPGGYVKYNDDDDNGTIDRYESGSVTDEDDLVEIKLSRSGAVDGTISLIAMFGGDNIKVWTTADKGTEVTLPKSWGQGGAGMPAKLYVECVGESEEARDVGLKLIWNYGGTGSVEDRVRITNLKVNIDIHHALGGSQVLDGKEDDKHGATAVANLNDTDGDGRADKDDTIVREAQTTLSAAAAKDATTITVTDPNGYNDGDNIAIAKADMSEGEARTVASVGANNVITLTEGLSRAYAVGSKVYHPGRDEVDLMKIVLRKPVDAGGNATLSLLGGNAKVWEESTKETPVDLPKQFAVANLPQNKELWVEATAVSGGLRDIILQWEYKGQTDIVKATAAWVSKPARSPWCKRETTSGLPDNPEPGPAKDLPDLTKASVLGYINTEYISAAGSRYGHGTCGKVDATDTCFGGRILYEFQIAPAGVDQLGVVFDITRQIHYRDYVIQNGSGTPAGDGSGDFPWLQSPPGDNERANDDGHPDDEDNTPSNRLIYSWDAPAEGLAAGGDAFVICRNTFKEWVRLKLEGGTFPDPGTQNVLEGSRASDKYPWHCVYYLKRDASGKWVEDNMEASYNAPVFTGNGNGTIDVTLLQNIDTEGFDATYDLANKKWTLDGTSSDPVHDQKAGEVPPGTKWTLTVAEKITVEITQGAAAFANGDTFDFSVFRSLAKKNETATGDVWVGETP